MIRDHWWEKDRRLINVASNAAYPAAGVALALFTRRPADWAIAGALLILGLGSGWYHWRASQKSRAADWAGMYLVLVALATAAASPGDPALWWILLAIGSAGAFALTYQWRRLGDDGLLGLILVLGLLPPLWGGWDSRLLAIASLAVFALAKVCHSADNRHAQWIGRWGHTVWHVGTAVAFALMALAGSRA